MGIEKKPKSTMNEEGRNNDGELREVPSSARASDTEGTVGLRERRTARMQRNEENRRVKVL